MELTAHYDKDMEIIVATPIGEVINDNIMVTVSKALELSEHHKCNHLLFDIRNCPINQSMTEAFELMSEANEKLGLTFKHFTAVVYDPKNFPTERAEFIENVVFNRGNPFFKMFVNRDEAIEWLKKEKE